LTGTGVVLELARFATPKVEREFIYLEKMDDGKWRLTFNVKDVDIRDIQALTFIREDNE
jgi:hypothetical protein